MSLAISLVTCHLSLVTSGAAAIRRGDEAGQRGEQPIGDAGFTREQAEADQICLPHVLVRLNDERDRLARCVHSIWR